MHIDYKAVLKKYYSNLEQHTIDIYAQGWDHVIYVVDGVKAFRFPQAKENIGNLKKEAAFLTLLRPSVSIRIPHLKLFNNDNKPYAVYDFIAGTQFTPDVSKAFTENELRELAHELGRFLTQIHSIPKEKAMKIGVGEVDIKQSWHKLFRKTQEKVYSLIVAEEQEWIEALFRNFLKTLERADFETRMIHSDMMPEHIIVDPEKHTLNGIIDFGDIEIGDPAYDFTYFGLFGKSFLDAVYRSYRLDRDEFFETRRIFYEERKPVANVLHWAKGYDLEKLHICIVELKNYIRNKKDS